MIKLKKKRTYKLKKKNVMDGETHSCDSCMHALRLKEFIEKPEVYGAWDCGWMYGEEVIGDLETFFSDLETQEKYAIVRSIAEGKAYLINGNALESITDFDNTIDEHSAEYGWYEDRDFISQRNEVWKKYKDTKFTLYEVIFEDGE